MLSLFLPSLSLCIMFSRLSSVMSLSPLRTHIRTRIVSNPTSGTSLASFSKDYTSPADYLKSIYNLEGKTAIVTGATGGIGAAVAEGLWMAGVNVVIHGRKNCAEEVNRLYLKEGRDSGLLPFAADVTKVEELKAMVEATVAAFGSVDILVNNAGMNLPEADFVTRTAEDWATISAVNMAGPIMLTQLCLPYLQQCPSGGRIINTCSIGGHAGLKHNILYTMTKGGTPLRFRITVVGPLRTPHPLTCRTNSDPILP